jgi:hypothetical protein
MKKEHLKYLLFAFIALLCNVTTYAHDFELDGIFFNINGDEAAVTFKGESSRDYSNEYYGDVVIPSSVTYEGKTYKVTEIERYAFDLNYKINSIVIPNSITTIGELAFQKCSGLTSVTIPNSVTYLDGYIFAFCDNLVEATLPNNLSHLGMFTFQDCPSLKSITIPDCVTEIVWGMFYGCKKLENVYIPKSVKSIDKYAFNSCETLKTIHIPDSVESIGVFSFFRCKELTSIYLSTPTPPATEEDAFSSYTYTNATLYVPKGTLEAYKFANVWKKFYNIEEFEPTSIKDTEEETPAIAITSAGIRLTAAEGKAVTVYTATGALIDKADSYAGEEIALEKGVYIIKIGNRSIKIKL